MKTAVHLYWSFYGKWTGAGNTPKSLLESSNMEPTCKAAVEAYDVLRPNIDSLTDSEQREAAYYYLAYSALAVTHGVTPYTDARLAQLDDPTSELSQIWNREHDQYVLRQLLALAEPNFEPNTWQAFCRVALEGAKADVVAQEMGVSKNAIIVAKCRVLNRLRQESEGLIESSSGFFAKS